MEDVRRDGDGESSGMFSFVFDVSMKSGEIQVTAGCKQGTTIPRASLSVKRETAFHSEQVSV